MVGAGRPHNFHTPLSIQHQLTEVALPAALPVVDLRHSTTFCTVSLASPNQLMELRLSQGM